MQLTEFVKQTVRNFDSTVKKAEEKAEEIEAAKSCAKDELSKYLECYIEEFVLEGRVVTYPRPRNLKISFDNHEVVSISITNHELGCRVVINCPLSDKHSDTFAFRVSSKEDVDTLFTKKDNLDLLTLIKQSILNHFNSGVKIVLDSVLSRL